jgi:hypothetical protein
VTALIAGLCLLVCLGCRDAGGREGTTSGASEGGASEGSAAATAPVSETVPPASGSSDLPCAVRVRPGQMAGMCYAHNHQGGGARGYGTDTDRASLAELAALGVDWISITPFGWQRDVHSTEIRYGSYGAGETDERLRRTIAAAHEAGLRVILKPHLWLSHNQWRGHIDPEGGDEGWARWFESYTAFILHHAALAQEAGADMLTVGVELGSSSRAHPERWREVIRCVREVYSGPIVYAANWDEADGVTFWDAVDYIGVQMFAPLTDHSEAGQGELAASAAQYLARWEALSARFERPLLLTEVGFKSIAGTAIAPYLWPEQLPPGAAAVSEAAQAEAYCAILETFGQSERVAGMFWWKWFTDPDTDEEGPEGFSPRGKLAEDVLRFAFSDPPADPSPE